jgi:SnoaL-like domain
MITPDIRCALDDLVASYALAVDRREFDLLGELFTDDAELLLPDPPHSLEPVHTHRGRAEIVAAMSALAGVPRTLHLLGGQVYRPGPGPDTVSGELAGSAQHLLITDTGASDLVWQLRYTDVYRSAGERWLISHRSLSIQWIEIRPVRTVPPELRP